MPEDFLPPPGTEDPFLSQGKVDEMLEGVPTAVGNHAPHGADYHPAHPLPDIPEPNLDSFFNTPSELFRIAIQIVAYAKESGTTPAEAYLMLNEAIRSVQALVDRGQLVLGAEECDECQRVLDLVSSSERV